MDDRERDDDVGRGELYFLFSLFLIDSIDFQKVKERLFAF